MTWSVGRYLLGSLPVSWLLFGISYWGFIRLSRSGSEFMHQRGMVRDNIERKPVPTAAASIGVAVQAVTIAAALQVFGAHSGKHLVPVMTLCFLALGLYDDWQAVMKPKQAEIKGWRGHFSAMLHAQPSSGAIKAVLGGAASLAGVYSVSSLLYPLQADAGAYGSLAGVLLGLPDAAIIALSANTINCLDVKPGRAAKFLAAAWLPMLLIPALPVPPLVGAAVFLAPVLGFLPGDLSGEMMMGDAGANAWGAMWGAAAVVLLPLYMRWILVGLLMAAAVVAETVTFSALIRSSGFLRQLDEWGCDDSVGR